MAFDWNVHGQRRRGDQERLGGGRTVDRELRRRDAKMTAPNRVRWRGLLPYVP